MAYPGLILTCFVNGTEHQRRWIPTGETPSQADDEQLIEALRRAQLWSSSDTENSEPCC
jgi:hypothetical protein